MCLNDKQNILSNLLNTSADVAVPQEAVELE